MRPSVASRPVPPHWYFIPVRILLVSFLLTLLSFAVSLLCGIVGTVIASRARGAHPNMTVAYRHIAFPVAIAVAVTALIVMTVVEIRRYQQTKALFAIERHSG